MKNLALVVFLIFGAYSTFSFAESVVCIDNFTLAINRTFSIDNEITNIVEYISCKNGCNSIFNICNPSRTLQAILLFLVILVVVYFTHNVIYSVRKWL